MYTESDSTPTNAPSLNKPSTSTYQTSVTATAPGKLRVIKRNGTVMPYAEDKIAIAVTKAFLA
ncbi:MAG: ribonucleoside-diphosphate reductase alpha chain, partial [Candidatus Endobugula sp.]